MSISLDLDIRGQLTGLRLGKIALSEFNRWFAATNDAAESHVDEDTWSVFLAVENVLAEFSGGHLTLEQVRETLPGLAVPDVVPDPVSSR